MITDGFHTVIHVVLLMSQWMSSQFDLYQNLWLAWMANSLHLFKLWLRKTCVRMLYTDSSRTVYSKIKRHTNSTNDTFKKRINIYIRGDCVL